MVLVGIDIGKNKHTFSIIYKGTGEIPSSPAVFDNNQIGFLYLIKKLSNYAKSELLIGMKIPGITILLCSNIFLITDIRLHLSTQQQPTLQGKFKAVSPKMILLIPSQFAM